MVNAANGGGRDPFAPVTFEDLQGETAEQVIQNQPKGFFASILDGLAKPDRLKQISKLIKNTGGRQAGATDFIAATAQKKANVNIGVALIAGTLTYVFLTFVIKAAFIVATLAAIAVFIGAPLVLG